MRFALLLILLCCACSNQAIYDTVQTNRRNECLKEPTPRYVQECLARTQMPFREYERLRKEAADDEGASQE